MEELNYTKLYKAYSCKGRKSAVNPILLFKVIVYAYMNNIYSTRKIEEACKRDVNFMWLLEGQVAPDHNTIALQNIKTSKTNLQHSKLIE